MIEIIETIQPYIEGTWALPWILVGFIVTFLLSHIFNEKKVNKLMKKIALVLLYVFVPLLFFRILLGIDFNENEISFTILCFTILAFYYIITYLYAKYKAKKMDLKEEKGHYIKTVLTNQGRSSAFVGGAMLIITTWREFVIIYMIIGAIFLFAIIPYILSYLHKKEIKDKSSKINALPWYLRIFPWYLLSFAIAAIIIHGMTGITPKSLGDIGIIFTFFTGLTIPAALYYVGSGIHPRDLKLSELKKLIGIGKNKKEDDHWIWVRHIFILTVIITPIITSIIFVPLLLFETIPKEWFAVIIINSILPITSTNMFLIPYGIDKKSTAHAVAWTTLVCVPIVVALITIFGTSLT